MSAEEVRLEYHGHGNLLVARTQLGRSRMQAARSARVPEADGRGLLVRQFGCRKWPVRAMRRGRAQG